MFSGTVRLQLADKEKQQEYEAVYDEKGNHVSYRVKSKPQPLPVPVKEEESKQVVPKLVLNQGVPMKEK